MQNKKQHPQRGFYYHVTDEQIKEHQQRTVEEIFEWLESTNEFLYKFQTAEERERMNKTRKGEF
ncbi:MAG: hypothetical protein ABI723_12285 [Bacteroidia bacterium]